jgi:hypothetical protein
MKPLQERFDAKVQRGEGCWRWTGAIGGGGYGNIKHVVKSAAHTRHPKEQ